MTRKQAAEMKNNAASELAGMRQRVTHACLECEKEFEAIKTAKYCSNACRQRAKYYRNRDKRR